MMNSSLSDNKRISYYKKFYPLQLMLLIIVLTVVVSEYTGIFSLRPQFPVYVIHTNHFLGLSIAFFVITLLRLAAGIGERLNLSLLVVQIALILFCTAVWLSRSTHFEGKSIRLEGQSMGGLTGDYVKSTIYTRKLRTPSLGFHLNKLTPMAGRTLSKLAKVKADIHLASSSSMHNQDISFSSSFPLYTAGTFVRITDFGYAPRFSMSTLNGTQVDSDYQYLKLFPAGSEDSFNPFTYGYTIALRLWPDYQDVAGKPSTRSLELQNPVFKVRIVRHKDIIYNDYIKLGEKLKFDSSIFQLHHPVKWAEFTLISDAGIYPLAGGIALLAISGVMSLFNRRKNSPPKAV